VKSVHRIKTETSQKLGILKWQANLTPPPPILKKDFAHGNVSLRGTNAEKNYPFK
jgi:hypothetical protein